MKNYFYKNDNQIGATAIFITLIILSSMLFVALTVNTIVVNGIRMSVAHLNSTKAYYAAESGTEKILWGIRKAGPPAINPYDFSWYTNNCVDFAANGAIVGCSQDCELGSNITEGLLNTSYYKIRYLDDGGSNATFQTTGIYKEITKRVVEVKYHF